jgi:hypothetical protein
MIIHANLIRLTFVYTEKLHYHSHAWGETLY